MFGEKLKYLRHKNRYSMDKLAAIYNERFGGRLNKSTISRYENGLQEPIFTAVMHFAELFNVTTDYLSNDSIPVDSIFNLPDIVPYNPTRRIPILGHISAGLPLFAEQHVEGYTYTDLDGGSEYFALRVTGDSMTAARIYDGDILIVRRQEEVENGSVAVVMVGDENATVKRFNLSGDTVTLSPQSFNPEHKMQVYNLKTTPIKVLGLVVKVEAEIK